MKNLILFFLLTVNLVNGSMLRWTSDFVNPESLDEKTRPILIQKLLTRMKTDDPDERNRAESSLISIGHPDTIKSVVDRMVQGERLTPLDYFGTGAAISYLMDGIDLASPERLVDVKSGFRLLSNRGSIIAAILNIIEYTETSFPVETKEWARRMRQYLGSSTYEEERLVLLKQWWQQNQVPILQKRYADATWLPMYKGKPSYLSDEEIEDRRGESRRAPVPRNPPGTQATPPKVEIIAKGEKTADSTTKSVGKTLWIGLAAIVALLAGIIGRKIKTGKPGME